MYLGKVDDEVVGLQKGTSKFVKDYDTVQDTGHHLSNLIITTSAHFQLKVYQGHLNESGNEVRTKVVLRTKVIIKVYKGGRAKSNKHERVSINQEKEDPKCNSEYVKE